MAEKATIARPYARAAFGFAQSKGQLAQWSEALAVLSAVAEDAQVRKLLGNPKVTADQIVQLLADVAGNRMTADVRNFVATLAANRRVALLPYIAEQYAVLRAKAENTADVQVVSAAELSDAQKQRLTQALQTKLKQNVRLACSVDASLMGGAVIHYGDLVIDGSLKARLQRLTTSISN